MSEFDQLVKQASKAAQNMGGLTAILLAIQGRKADKVQWDKDKAQFEVDGKVIPAAAIQIELGRIELKIASLIISYNNKLWLKQWDVKEWRAAMTKLIEDNHTLFGALALGGIVVALKDPTVIRRKDRDAKALAGFARAQRQGTIPSLPMMNNRGKTYIRAAYATYQLLNQRAHILAGFTEAKRVLTPAEHCRNKLVSGKLVEGCLEAARRGWMPIREVPPIGTLVCVQFCKCYIIYR